MEYFLSQLTLVFPVLGFQFLQAKPIIDGNGTSQAKIESPLFTLTVAGTDAKAREIAGEFIVLKGSTARVKGIQSWTSYRSQREQLVREGKLVPSDQADYYVFTDDVAFSSPSAGGAVVNAGNINGRTAWKVAGTNKTYQDWHEQRLQLQLDTDSHAGDE